MRAKIKNTQIGIIFLVLLASCSPLNQELNLIDQQSIYEQYSENSPKDPVKIWSPIVKSKEQNINSFLNTFSSDEGKKLEVVEKRLIPNPDYKLPRIKLYNIFTNEVLNKRKGEFLEVYTLRSSKDKDTLYLYIAPHERTKKFVAAGLNNTRN